MGFLFYIDLLLGISIFGVLLLCDVFLEEGSKRERVVF